MPVQNCLIGEDVVITEKVSFFLLFPLGDTRMRYNGPSMDKACLSVQCMLGDLPVSLWSFDLAWLLPGPGYCFTYVYDVEFDWTDMNNNKQVLDGLGFRGMWAVFFFFFFSGS